jgi:hypothetical protein
LILLGFCPFFGLLRKPIIDYNNAYFSAPVLNLILRQPLPLYDTECRALAGLHYVAERLFSSSNTKFRGGRIVLERLTDGNNF